MADSPPEDKPKGPDPFANVPFAKPLAPAPKINKAKFGLLVPVEKPKTELELEIEKELAEEKAAKETEAKERRKQEAGEVPIMYTAPFWYKYTLELVNNGVSQGKKPLYKKGWYLIGRAPICDISLDHPSVSRQHAVIQYKRNGEAFIYDLGSTHGTFIGKVRIQPNNYVPIIQGNNIIRFGTSSRFYILENDQGREVSDDEDEEEGGGSNPKPHVPAEEVEGGEKSKRQEKREKKQKKKKVQAADEDQEAAIKELEEEEDEMAFLDEHKEFYEEYYKGDDDDQFFDRTGQVEKRRQKKAAAAKGGNEVETYDTLAAKERVLGEQKAALEKEIAELTQEKEILANSAGAEDLDAYMAQLNSSLVDQKLKKKKDLLVEVTTDYARYSRLAGIAKPALASLANNTYISPEQIQRVTEFTEDLKRKKRETDLSETDADEEKRRGMKEKMNEMARKRKEEKEKARLASGTVAAADIKARDERKLAIKAEIEAYKPSFVPGRDKLDDLPKPPSDAMELEAAHLEKHPNVQRHSLMEGLSHLIQGEKKRKQRDEDDVEEDAGNEDEDEDDEGEKKAERTRGDRPKKRAKRKEKKPQFDEEVEGAYEVWAPPLHQTGDGKTHLNAKFGY